MWSSFRAAFLVTGVLLLSHAARAAMFNVPRQTRAGVRSVDDGTSTGLDLQPALSVAGSQFPIPSTRGKVNLETIGRGSTTDVHLYAHAANDGMELSGDDASV